MTLPNSSAEVEALAAVRALSFVSEIDFSSTILEGDSKVIINSLKIIYVSLTTYGNLIFEAKLIVGLYRQFIFSVDERYSSTPQCCTPSQDLLYWIQQASSQKKKKKKSPQIKNKEK